jgi:hypothetical protein
MSSYYRNKNFYSKKKKATSDSEPKKPKAKRRRVDANENGVKGVFVHDIFGSKRVAPEDDEDLIIASFDPAFINFCVRVECRNKLGEIRSLVYEVIDLRGGDKTKNLNDIFVSLTKVLLKIEKMLQMCHYIVIEKQLSSNVNATRIMQHIITFIYSRDWKEGNFPLVCEFEPLLKYKVVGAPYGTKREDIKKKWAPEYAITRLTEGNDEEGLQKIKSKKKKDDLADTLILVDAFETYFINGESEFTAYNKSMKDFKTKQKAIKAQPVQEPPSDDEESDKEEETVVPEPKKRGRKPKEPTEPKKRGRKPKAVEPAPEPVVQPPKKVVYKLVM